MTEQKAKESPKAIVVREPYPGSSKQSVRVVYGFADEVEAGVFALQVATKHNVLLDADREYRQGKPIVAEVISVAEELKRRGYKADDFDKAVQFRRDDIADRERFMREEHERKLAEQAAKEKAEAVAKIKERKRARAEQEAEEALAAEAEAEYERGKASAA